MHPKNYALVTPIVSTPLKKGFKVNVDILARLDEFSEMMYTLIGVMVYTFCISFYVRF